MIRIGDIQRAVASAHGIAPAELCTGTRRQRISRPRQIAMTLARELTPLSLPQIGRAFGVRSHTTVLHAIERVRLRAQSDADFARELSALRNKVGASPGLRGRIREQTEAANAIARFARALGERRAHAGCAR